jgi:hypothetical protein
MNNKAKPRSKQAYLKSSEVQEKIAEGILDQYDLVYEIDTSQYVIIDKDKNPRPIKSRVDTYNSIAEANNIINQRLDTYRGQILCINNNNEYMAYTVQYNEETGKYYVTSVASSEVHISYNQLSEVPITNLVAAPQDNVPYREPRADRRKYPHSSVDGPFLGPPSHFPAA